MSNKPSRYRRKMRVETLTMPVDPNDVHRFRSEQNRLVAAAAALDRVKVGHAKPDAIAEAETELADAQKALDAKLVELGVPTMTFTFQALSPAKLEALLADHPPSKDQIDAARRADPDGPLPDYNGITYPPALLAATCTRVEWSEDGQVDNGISEDDAAELFEHSSTGDQGLILNVIGGVNNVPSLVSDLGKDSGGTRGSGPSPTTAAREASPPSSS
jgi:hypothetical protein